MKVVKASAMPPRVKRKPRKSKYRDAVNAFVRSGFDLAEVTLDEGEKVANVHRGLSQHAQRAGVRVMMRGERLFLEREVRR